MTDQSRFEDCYRGRQSRLHHVAYMRMAKVLVALYVFQKIGINLRKKHIFDYGFGAGTLFHYCPQDAFLYGVEQDALHIRSVEQNLRERGYGNVDLQPIEISSWKIHPLLARKYDVIVCSHVLEHISDQPEFLKRLSLCLESSGVFLGVVPINERVMNPHHTTKVDHEMIEGWAKQSGLRLTYYGEFDPIMYWIQPLFNYEQGVFHKLAQAVSLALGSMATFLGPQCWDFVGRIAGALTFSKPTQAAFILQLPEII